MLNDATKCQIFDLHCVNHEIHRCTLFCSALLPKIFAFLYYFSNHHTLHFGNTEQMDKHTRKEDFIAILTGSCLVAQGVAFLQAGHLITGGTAGLSLLLTHILPLSFGTLYFLTNLPSFVLAWQRFGRGFAVNTIIAIVLVSAVADLLPAFVQFSTINTYYSAVFGGLLMGLGMLILFRHRSSLGGFNVVCLFIQDKWGISVGKTQVFLDTGIVIASLFYLPLEIIAISALGAIVLNIVLAMNHKPSRYVVTYGSPRKQG